MENKMKNNQIKTVLLLMVLMAASLLAQTGGKYYTNDNNVAINGNDVVSYFTRAESVRGNNTHIATHDGVNFWFASEEHKNLFIGNPDKYLPQYGGYCAFAMAKHNAKVSSDPSTFKIVDGKLYLFFNDYYKGTPMNTMIPWNGDEAKMRITANENWKKMQ